MKKIIALALIAIGISTASFAQETMKMQDHKMQDHKMQHHKKAKTMYTCTMHPEVVRSKPGKCPKCGMKLVKKQPGMTKKDKMGDMKM